MDCLILMMSLILTWEVEKMSKTSPNDMLSTDSIQIGVRDGTEVQKGVTLNESYLKKNYEQIGKMLQIFTAYPDVYLDTIRPEGTSFSLFFYQRIVLRALMRYKDIFITAPRAFSKSFIVILGMFLQCCFMPGTKRFICAPNKNQSAQIAKEKLTEIYDRWPLLRREVIGGEVNEIPGNFGKDYVTIKFKNGSQLDVVGALDSARGGRRQGGLIDEIRKLNFVFRQNFTIFVYKNDEKITYHQR